MRWLDDERLNEVYEAALRARIPPDAGLGEDLKASFLPMRTLNAQVLHNLQEMNGIEALTDGSVPLRTWLATARSLAAPRKEASVFEAALADMPAHRASPSSRRPAWVLWALVTGGIALGATMMALMGRAGQAPSGSAVGPPPVASPPAASPSLPGTTRPPDTASSAAPTAKPTGGVTTPPPAATASTTASSSAPAVAMSGPASCGRSGECMLWLGGGSAPPSSRICLGAPASAEALAGVTPTCLVTQKSASEGRLTCRRSDVAAGIPLEAPITWSVCGP